MFLEIFIFWLVTLTYFLTEQHMLLRNKLAWTVHKFSSSLLSVSSQQIKNCADCPFLLPNYKLPLCDFVFTARILFSFSQIPQAISPSLSRLILEECDLFQPPTNLTGMVLSSESSAIYPNLKGSSTPCPRQFPSTAPGSFSSLLQPVFIGHLSHVRLSARY